MDFKEELAKYGYNRGDSVAVETLTEEILPAMFKKMNTDKVSKNTILNMVWEFCETEFGADFENDYIKGKGSKTGLSDRTEVFAQKLVNLLNKK